MSSLMRRAYLWAVTDYQSNRVRFVAEWVAWTCSMAGAITFNLSQPSPPMGFLYPLWLVNLLIFTICSYSRRATWMAFNYTLLTIIDMIGYTRWLLYVGN